MNESQSWGRWIREWVSLTLGVLVATHVVDGIKYDGTGTLLLVVVVLSLLNSLVRPFLRLFFVLVSLPLLVVTYGLAAVLVLWVVNSLLFYFTGVLIPGFEVASFGDAMWGALWVSVVSWVLIFLLGDGGGGPGLRVGVNRGGVQGRRLKDDDVIDV